MLMKRKNLEPIRSLKSGGEMVRKPQRTIIRKELLRHYMIHLPVFIIKEERKKKTKQRILCLPIGKTGRLDYDL